MISYLISTILLLVTAKAGTYQDDQVSKVPGWSNYHFDVYSGMLNANQSGNRQLHYMFLESQGNPTTDPLVIWLNGGPGCSSLLGLIQENGPFQFKGNSEYFTDMQEYSWNKDANVLYIESPAGVGFSVNHDPSYTYTDPHTAEDMMYAFNQWLDRFAASPIGIKSKQLWISGESYGGMYIPFFADQIVQQNEKQPSNKINLQGFLIGNGAWILNWNFLGLYQMNTYPLNYFFSNKIANQWYDGCLQGKKTQCLEYLQYYNNVSNNTDIYQIYNYTYTYGGPSEVNQKSFFQNNVNSYIQQELKNFNITEEMNVMEQKQEKIKEQMNLNTDIEEPKCGIVSPDDVINQYFNLPEVQQALHVPSKNWSQCNDTINGNYNSSKNSTHLYPEFFEKGLQILIYSGNNDGAVPYPYTWYCMEDLMKNYNVDMKISDKWRQWGPMPDKQVGGMVQTWSAGNNGSKFHFATVRGAGHEVPMYQPASAYQMFYNFTHGIPI